MGSKVVTSAQVWMYFSAWALMAATTLGGQ